MIRFCVNPLRGKSALNYLVLLKLKPGVYHAKCEANEGR
jgi:hypothetical protein